MRETAQGPAKILCCYGKLYWCSCRFLLLGESCQTLATAGSRVLGHHFCLISLKWSENHMTFQTYSLGFWMLVKTTCWAWLQFLGASNKSCLHELLTNKWIDNKTPNPFTVMSCSQEKIYNDFSVLSVVISSSKALKFYLIFSVFYHEHYK